MNQHKGLPIVETVSDKPAQVFVHSSELVYQGAVLDMRVDTLSLHEGAPSIKREYVDHPGAVAVVALQSIDEADYICLVSQYRHPVGKILWEVPAGLLDIKGEDYLEAAKRELREEAELEAKQWDVLLDFYTTPGGNNEGLRVFLARDVSKSTDNSFVREDEEEQMQAVWVRLEDAYQAVVDGRLHNPSAIVGILSTMAARGRNWETLRSADAPWNR